MNKIGLRDLLLVLLVVGVLAAFLSRRPTEADASLTPSVTQPRPDDPGEFATPLARVSPVVTPTPVAVKPKPKAKPRPVVKATPAYKQNPVYYSPPSSHGTPQEGRDGWAH